MTLSARHASHAPSRLTFLERENERLRAALTQIREVCDDNAVKASVESGWRSMETAPRNATEILLEVPRKGGGWPTHMRIVAHWADGGGDEQPRFRGWFRDTGYDYAEIELEPVRWAPLPEHLERR